MTENYKRMLKKGVEYQDFLITELIKFGIIIMPYSSRNYQYNKGESYTRHEIKFDDKMAETGNLYIETHEKAKIENANYVKSGINRIDNTLFFIIGNYDKAYLFSKKILKKLIANPRFHRVETPTSRGVLLSTTDAENYSNVFDFRNNKTY